MSDSEPEILKPEPVPQQPDQQQSVEEDQRSSGPNLTLFYSLIALALAAAIAVAMMIVLPFYRRR